MKSIIVNFLFIFASFNLFAAENDSSTQAKGNEQVITSTKGLDCASFGKADSEAFKYCQAMEIINAGISGIYAKSIATKIKKEYENKELSADDMKKYNQYLDYKPSSSNDFSNCTKNLADEVSCPEGTYKFINGKTGEKIQDNFKRNSKEIMSPTHKDSEEKSPNSVSK